MSDAVDILNVSFDSSEKDLPAIAIFKPLKNGRNKLLKMVVGEQADLLYYALTNQEVEICLKEVEK